MLEDPSLMPVDCQLQRVEEKLSKAAYDGKCVMPVGGQNQRVFECRQEFTVKLNTPEHHNVCTQKHNESITNQSCPFTDSMDVSQLGYKDEQMDGNRKYCGGTNCQPDECRQSKENLAEIDGSKVERDYEHAEDNELSQLLLLSSMERSAASISGQRECEVKVNNILCQANRDDGKHVGCTSSVNKDSPSSPNKSATMEIFEGPVARDVQVDESKARNLDSLVQSDGEKFPLQSKSINTDLLSDNSSDECEISSIKDNMGVATPIESSSDLLHKDREVCREDWEIVSTQSSDFTEHVKALWVKWRGKWQTGFQCRISDCPLSTLKAKPTHGRKSYIVVFFPRSRTYQWVDMLLTCPIKEYPVPLVNGTHRKWRKLIKDLGTPRKYIIQKLAMAMLNIFDGLHIEAVVENARKAAIWKEFAKKASLCESYADLGRMLIKLYHMILPNFLNPGWLQNSFDQWAHRCENAQTAQCIEILNEEFMHSVLSKKIDELRDAPTQPVLDPEWKTWKQEAMKMFISLQPFSNARIVEKKKNENDADNENHTCRKRPKLEVKHPEAYTVQVRNDTSNLLAQEDKNLSYPSVKCPRPLELSLSGDPSVHHAISSFPVQFTANQESGPFEKCSTEKESSFIENEILNKYGESQGAAVAGENGNLVVDSYRSYRQCSAYCETEGRQCGRWASEGGVCCCVHEDVSNALKSSRSDKIDVSSNTGLLEMSETALTIEQHKVGKFQENRIVKKVSYDSNFIVQNKSSDENGELEIVNASLPNVVSESNLLISSRQCAAFIEIKGKKCGRLASEGDVYCCVHQNINNACKTSRDEKVPQSETFMCSGMTNAGRSCKHRAQQGSAFCKKHQFQINQEIGSSSAFSCFPLVPVKKVDRECKLSENFASSLHMKNHDASDLSKVLVSDTSDGGPCPSGNLQLPLCIGYSFQGNAVECKDHATRHSLYCENHIPRFLKRARDGKSRLISKDVVVNLLKGCSARTEKVHLHQACEFLYGFLKSSLSRQDPVVRSGNMEQLLAEASKDSVLGEYLLKVVSTERAKLTSMWGFGKDDTKLAPSIRSDSPVVGVPSNEILSSFVLKCKICTQAFSDDHKLGLHWTDVHKREARWLFRGYACAICMKSDTNRKVLENHIKEGHGTQYLHNSLLFRCMSCNSHFANPELLWQHVLSSHAREFSLSHSTEQALGQTVQPMELLSTAACNISTDHKKAQKFTCKICGMKFDLLPDLGRHHQAAHMSIISANISSPGRGKYQINHSKLSYHDSGKSLKPSGRLKKQKSFGIQKNIKVPDLVLTSRTHETVQTEAVNLGNLSEFQCSNVASSLYSKMVKSKALPTNLEILSVARAACCRNSLRTTLEGKYGKLPQNLCLKAAKLCSEMDIFIDWHREGYQCPQGCQPQSSSFLLSPLQPLQDKLPENSSLVVCSSSDTVWDMEEYHFVIDSNHFGWKSECRKIVLCEDVSFGKERISIACVNIIPSPTYPINCDGQCQPWQEFNYITDRLLLTPLLYADDTKMGCNCSNAECLPEKCDHVLIFDHIYEHALDVYGTPMKGRFAYDTEGQIILQDGFPVYECGNLCNCNSSCPNRVLQNGIKVKLEIFLTSKKGWAVRSAEPIKRGTFVCEFVGEVLRGDEAIQRKERCLNERCCYMYDVAAHFDTEKFEIEDRTPCVIDATKYGNISRFINHSCSPNLFTRLVLAGDCKDCSLARVGFFANQDIPIWEELTYDYAWELLPGEGSPCFCGSACCRGRIC